MAILLFTFVLSFLLSRSLTKPLKLLTEAGQRISSTGIEAGTIPVTGSIETRRLGLILNQMLGSGSLEPTDINCGLQSTVTVASNEWKNVTDIELLFEEALPLVPCYADELNQAFLNMIINSVHAIQEHNHTTEGKKGLITIQTLTAGNDVHIRISDTGGGMEDSTLKKVFDPFFTTKDVGVGTGQGLTIAYDIIKIKHQGSINVESVLGKGTTFIISIPIDPPGKQS